MADGSSGFVSLPTIPQTWKGKVSGCQFCGPSLCLAPGTALEANNSNLTRPGHGRLLKDLGHSGELGEEGLGFGV